MGRRGHTEKIHKEMTRAGEITKKRKKRGRGETEKNLKKIQWFCRMAS